MDVTNYGTFVSLISPDLGMIVLVVATGCPVLAAALRAGDIQMRSTMRLFETAILEPAILAGPELSPWTGGQE